MFDTCAAAVRRVTNKSFGDLGIAAPVDQQAQHFQFSHRERFVAVDVGARGPEAQLMRPREVVHRGLQTAEAPFERDRLAPASRRSVAATRSPAPSIASAARQRK